MKRTALFLALLLSLSLLCACAETPPPATTAPSLPPETTIPAGTTLPPETTAPAETTEPAAADPYEQWYDLLTYGEYPQRNWLRKAMNCVFERPEELDLYYVFYNGFRCGSWESLSAESEQYLIDQGFWRDLDIQPMAVADLEKALQANFGVSLADVTIPEEWVYVVKEDVYCTNHNDAYTVHEFTITNVHDDGETIAITYAVDSYYDQRNDEYLHDAELVLTLHRLENGSFQAVSNLIKETDYASLSDQELINLFSTEEAMEIWNYSSSIHPLSDEGMEYLCSLSPAFAELYRRETCVESLAQYATQRSQELYEDPALQRYALPLYVLADYLYGGVEIPEFFQK